MKDNITEVNKHFYGNKIWATDKEHLKKLIEKEIELNGEECDLNHINVSKVTDMSGLFQKSHFNGDISKWDVSNVIDMRDLFCQSEFNGDISQWDISSVKNTNFMFYNSKFNGDISRWDVSNVEGMEYMFAHSIFNGDISNWKPYCLTYNYNTLENCNAARPYWVDIEDIQERNKVIDAYHLKKELVQELNESGKLEKKMKI
jgi:surface protein